jgi:16S rRNA (adenine1518-N6/adenine1519-N6)-dimethyltransferase
MDLSILPPLGQIIKDFGLLDNKKFSKSLGQNFLLDPSITDRIVQFSGPLKDVDVIEIGPGPGGLTRSILKQNPHHLYAIEKDRTCIAALQSLINASQGKLTLVQMDALKIVPQNLTLLPIRIIANLPYNVGTQLLLGWLKNLERIQSLTLMFQREVALRVVAKAGDLDYGRLSVICQYLCETEYLLDLPPQAFTPPPKVFSSVVQFYPKNLSVQQKELVPFIEKVTAAAFGQRRKMIRKSLRQIFTEEKLINILNSLGLSPLERPENLNLAHYISLAEAYSQG